MRLSDLLALFPSDVVFVRLNDRPFDLRRYSGLNPDRWADKPRGRWVAVALASHSEANAADSWPEVFQRIAEAPGTPEAAVLAVVDEVENQPTGLILRLAEDQGLQFVAAFPLQYKLITAALVAVPTENPVSLSRWLKSDALPRESDGSSARLAYSQFVLSDLRRRTVNRQQAYSQDRAHHIEQQVTNSLVKNAEQNARRIERDLRVQHKAAIESLNRQLQVADLRTTANSELYESVRRSSAYRLGNLIGRSLRNPFKAVIGFPRELTRIIRDRGAAAIQAKRAELAVQALEQELIEHPTLIPVPTYDNSRRFGSLLRFPDSSSQDVMPSIAYIANPAYGGLRRSAWQYDLVPNNAIELLERRLPDVLVIDSSAFLPGSPWSGGASAIDPAKTALLVEVMGVARQYSVPCVFRWDSRPSSMPMLTRVAASSDLVVASHGGTADPDQLVIGHGVELDTWLTPRSDPPKAALAVFGSSDLASLRSELPGPETFDALGPDWQVHRFAPSAIHEPATFKQILELSGFAYFPPFDYLHLPVLEALAAGIPVVGSRNMHFKDLHALEDVEWNGRGLVEIQGQASGRAT